MADKGTKGEACARSVCTNWHAVYYNSSTLQYYCFACAGRINYWSIKDDGVILCKLEGTGS